MISRWLRLLFGREFALQDLLLLWDAIFGEGDDFGLINYVVVAMLIRIRDKCKRSTVKCLRYQELTLNSSNSSDL